MITNCCFGFALKTASFFVKAKLVVPHLSVLQTLSRQPSFVNRRQMTHVKWRSTQIYSLLVLYLEVASSRWCEDHVTWGTHCQKLTRKRSDHFFRHFYYLHRSGLAVNNINDLSIPQTHATIQSLMTTWHKNGSQRSF